MRDDIKKLLNSDNLDDVRLGLSIATDDELLEDVHRNDLDHPLRTIIFYFGAEEGIYFIDDKRRIIKSRTRSFSNLHGLEKEKYYERISKETSG